MESNFREMFASYEKLQADADALLAEILSSVIFERTSALSKLEFVRDARFGRVSYGGKKTRDFLWLASSIKDAANLVKIMIYEYAFIKIDGDTCCFGGYVPVNSAREYEHELVSLPRWVLEDDLEAVSSRLEEMASDASREQLLIEAEKLCDAEQRERELYEKLKAKYSQS